MLRSDQGLVSADQGTPTAIVPRRGRRRRVDCRGRDAGQRVMRMGNFIRVFQDRRIPVRTHPKPISQR